MTKQNEFFNIENRRYLGNKQKLLPFIDEVITNHTQNVETIADIFGGTGVVANYFSTRQHKIIVNDILYSNVINYNTFLGQDKIQVDKIQHTLEILNDLPGITGYVTKNFGGNYFSIDNAMKIDAIREYIETQDFMNHREKDVLLSSLLYAMDKVAHTVGHFDAYRKNVTEDQKIRLLYPRIVQATKQNEIFNEDANELVKNIKVDLIYIDTPYNSRGYENAYHVLENIMEWKKPLVEGITKKAVNRKEKSSAYNKKEAPQAFQDLIQHINAKYILVSYNNMENKGNARSNAKISFNEIKSILESKGETMIFEQNYQPFNSGHTTLKDHKELLYLCRVNHG